MDFNILKKHQKKLENKFVNKILITGIKQN